VVGGTQVLLVATIVITIPDTTTAIVANITVEEVFTGVGVAIFMAEVAFTAAVMVVGTDDQPVEERIGQVSSRRTTNHLPQ